MEFTSAQRSLIESESGGFFEACPGAGKTQTIVERFVQRGDSENSQRGVALITFTNAAAEEAQRRCAHEPELLRAPNFVGTIDSFIIRFFAAPFYKAKFRRSPTFWESWSSLDIATVQDFKGRPISLDEFRFFRGGAELSQQARRGRSPQEYKSLEQRAFQKLKSLLNAGHLDSGTARLMAEVEIEKHTYGIGDLVAARFEEIIVDEVQDCNSSDLLILNTLQDAGIRLITVGDIDQSIYEFRGTLVSDVRDFVDSRNRQSRININFRSSPAICKVVDSLREGSGADIAGGVASSCEAPVHLVGYGKISDIGPSVKSVMSHYQELSQPVFLAHKGDDAALAAGGRAKGRLSSSKVVILARSCNQLLNPSSTSAKRTRALTDIGLSLQRLHPDRVLAEASEEQYLAHLGLTKGAYRELCLRFAVAAGNPAGLLPSAYREKIVTAADRLEIDLNRKSLRTPASNVWIWDEAPPAEYQFEHSNIHQFKGMETDSVTLIIPHGWKTRKTLQEWREGIGSEARRVLYVGVSRAKRLLILAVHNEHLGEVKEILERDNVPLALS